MKRLIRGLIGSTGNEIHRLKRPAIGSRQTIHFLHIGKNAGTQISNISSQINNLSTDHVIVKHKHDVFLKDIPREDPYFFSVRNPVSRFKSGFYSRKRKGQPRIYAEWSSHDEIAFSEFEHANELAETLFEPGKKGHAAWAAMKSIRHTSQNQCDWFSCSGNFLRVRPPISIIRVENFDADLKKLLSSAFPNIDLTKVDFGVDEVGSHKNNYAGAPPLSEKAKENLTKWYSQDIAFYDMCEEWIGQSGSFQEPSQKMKSEVSTQIDR